MCKKEYHGNKRIFALVLLLLLPVAAFAAQSIGDVATNLLGPTSILTKFVDIACYIIGLVFIMMSIAQYKIHRQSPKLVPLMTPVLLVVLGVIALCIPYVTRTTETGKVKVESTEKSTLPLPGASEKSPGLPYPPSHKQDEAAPANDQNETAPTPPPAAPSDSSGTGTGGGGWTSDPKYN